MFKKLLLACLIFIMPLMAEVKVLAFAGSIRKDSYNKKLILLAAETARQQGAKVTVIDLSDYAMPFYNADLEAKQGLPVNAKKLRDLILQNDAIMIASPEYNASIPGLLKNAIDWTSHDEKGDYSPGPYKGKKIAIMSASPGPAGGARALVHLRSILEAMGGTVIQAQVTVPEAYKAFDEKGKLVSAELSKKLQEEVQQLVK
ncbi:MAG TPA: NAD(P)H-dependent oxidoreductase [Rhabdochlamydiaceae bacterium]|jgi:NAD(P)H-dependent FMN reductase|nr:NAD(P)H-dependent oxidoreductase [Rhabdochlamydiaceae bacterium]